VAVLALVTTTAATARAEAEVVLRLRLLMSFPGRHCQRLPLGQVALLFRELQMAMLAAPAVLELR
jgi:hypothetical protein